ncbi:serine/arginine repetitive matrix protein 2 isoform X2 [Nematostella vectensis]|nr:serine/arginine repetitive matrix protein 2 isoform X2 [Nematostella vectensis]XP_048580298.1 serine/arginine repetitive matrix protein 2 isoform X2 [Nematostella vectensis]
MYALGGKWKERKRRRKLERRAKGQRLVIPDAAFYADTDHLPKFDEVKIQEELSTFYDPSSITLASDYACFKYSMGGNLKLYDDHIALSSPKRKIKKPSYSPCKTGSDYDHLKLETSGEKTGELINDSMDLTGKKRNGSLNETGDDMDFGATHLRASFEHLDISDMPGKLLSSNASRISRKSGFEQEVESPRYFPSKDRDYSPIRTDAKERSPDYMLTAPTTNERETNCSPAPKPGMSTGTRHDSRPDDGATDAANTDRSMGAKDTWDANKHGAWDANKHGAAGMNVLQSMSRYDRTLNYVNQQSRTLQTGDYNELNAELSDLSSEVFTDGELLDTIPDSGNWSNDRLDKDFYPDSPTSEFAFSKTPCSSRKNSVESLLSEDSIPEETPSKMPIRTSIVVNANKTTPLANGPTRSTTKMFVPTATKKAETKNAKAKTVTPGNTAHRQGGGRGKITKRKVDYSNTKSKVNSFANFNHTPGGGSAKIPSKPIASYRTVEPRTDTHGIEAYSNLPAEFQEIARRLARQDKDLRNISTSGSSSGGRSRPRSRISSNKSGRGGSLSPNTERRTVNHTKGPGSHLSASALSLGSTKKRHPVNRTPSLHSRPVTPSLSRSHPATYCTPHSRPTSRSSSPVRSRNSSPTRSHRSRPSSRSSSPNRGRRSRTSSPRRNRSHNASPTGNRQPIGSSPARDASSRNSSSKEKSRRRSPSRNRLNNSRPTTPVSDILSVNARSVFQVIPVSR